MAHTVISKVRFKLIYFCVALFASCLFSCTQKSVATVQSAPFFIIGSGGGVSGQYIEYKVFENGRVQLYDFKSKKYIPYSTLSTSLNEKLWSQLHELNLSNLNLDQPGNYNYYIEIAEDDLQHKIKWSDESEMLPKGLKRFFSTAENGLRQMK